MAGYGGWWCVASVAENGSWWQEMMHANSLPCSNFPWQHYSRKFNLSSETSASEDDVSVSNRSVLAAIESSRLRLANEAAGGALPVEFIGENSSDHQSHLWGHLLLSGGSTSGGLDYKSQPQEIGESSMLINLSSSPSSNTTAAAATTTTATTATTNFMFDIMSSSDDDYLNRMGTTTTLDHHHHHQDFYNAFINRDNDNLHQYGGGGDGQTEMFDHHRLPPLSFTDEHLLQGVSYNHNGIMGSACFPGGNGLNEYNCSGAPDLIKANPAGCFGNGSSKKRGAAVGLHTSPSRAPSTCSTISRSNSGRCQGSLATTKDAKKKKLEEHVEKMILKRPKDEKSSSKEEKMIQQQVPKVKLADKITALQQIVSPFGKTDTASVLWEALGHIRFLQEQIQLLTNAHAKSNAIRKDVPWGGFIVAGGRKDAGGGGGEDDDVDLRSRGLCLVPTSFTPLIIREKNSNASDYLIPTYRGCLYG
ncbi:hypothetical protein DM860_001726 [Cuscuta australis]|uniref:BHLH domain-containing protein n=1 Tax=Cuscuta australis TaxID=267555 RepID=A0A328ED41_9ASTE|nr:hypothetical protein DM860_001726 [Cuscuta australis]